MSTLSELPSNWRLDFKVKDFIPKPHDWSSFKRVPFAPRYAACICGGGVYDLQRRVFLKPRIDKRNGRVRYRLRTDDLAAGKRGATRMPYYSSIILTLVEGTRRNRTIQAHHKDHVRTRDHWLNLGYATAKENRRMAVEHQSREGAANPNAKDKLTRELATFITAYDNEMREHGRVDLRYYAEHFETSTDHLRRIAQGKVRTAEVRAIRERLHREREEQHRHEREELRKRRTGNLSTGNPFLDAASFD